MVLSEFFLYAWVVSIASGPVVNIWGDKIILLLFVGLTICLNCHNIDKQILGITWSFAIFICLKSIGADVVRSSDYHSLWFQYVKITEIIIMILCLNCIVNSDKMRDKKIILRCKMIFNFAFYLTITVTILMLIQNGKGYYRDYVVTNPLFAPQFFLIYSIVLAYLLTCELLTYPKNRVINLIKIIINAIFVYLMNYTTQLLFFFIAIALAVIVTIGKNRLTKIILTAALFFSILVIIPNLANILLCINDRFFSQNPDVSMRLVNLSDFFSKGDLTGEALSLRLQVMYSSLHSFAAHPYWGIPFSKYNTETLTTIGGHHEWIDDLAKFGIVGFTLYVLFLYKGLKPLVISIQGQKRFGVFLYIVLILFGLLDPVIDMNTINMLIVAFAGVKAKEARLSSEKRINQQYQGQAHDMRGV